MKASIIAARHGGVYMAIVPVRYAGLHMAIASVIASVMEGSMLI
jgi:uncharacterized protein (DUF2062 family)